jgi:3-methyladenine DNA glycosylase AlkD
VETGTVCILPDYFHLGNLRFCLVEALEALVVAKTMLANSDQKKIASLENELVRRIQGLAQFNTQSLRAVRREFSRQLAKSPPEFVIALALQLHRSASVPRFVAYELVQNHPALSSLNAKLLKELGERIADWAAVDCFACYLAGPAWRENQVSDALIERWARSTDRWWRRAALVSTVPLNNKARGGHGNARKTLKICRMLVDDRDDMVVKALSWALRELSKRDAQAVRSFVKENRDQLAARVVREVNNKLKTGLKNPAAF